MKIRETPIAVIDFETTGRYTPTDRIVEATVVRIEPGGSLNVAFDSLINPQRSIDYEATQVHGITSRDVRDAPTFEEAASHFFEAVSDCVIASYNIYFDMPFLRNEMNLLGISEELPHFCVMYLRSAIQGGGKMKLGEACRETGIALKNSHHALDDTYATAELLNYLLDSRWNVSTFRDLAAIKEYKFWESFKHDLVPWDIASKLPQNTNLKSRSLSKTNVQPKANNTTLAKPVVIIKPKIENNKPQNMEPRGNPVALFNAIKNGKLEIVTVLLRNNPQWIDAKDQKGKTLLHHAVAAENLEIVQFLVENGVNTDIKDAEGISPLWLSMVGEGWEEVGKNLEIARYLIELGAEVNECNRSGCTLLQIAEYNDSDLAKMLIEYGAEESINEVGRDWEKVKWWLERNPSLIDIEIIDEEGESATLLHYAAAGNGANVEVLKYLVSRGADVNAKSDGGASPLHWAATHNTNVEVLKYLVSQGADIGVKTEDGISPLHSAAYNSNVEIMKYLASQGADINAKTKEGWTPLHEAAGWQSNIEGLKCLVSQGANVNAKLDDGRTPLHQAAERNSNSDVLRYLVSQGANVNAKKTRAKHRLTLPTRKRRNEFYEQ